MYRRNKDALERKPKGDLEVADNGAYDGIDGAPSRVGDDGELAVEREHHRLWRNAREHLELNVARLDSLELSEAAPDGHEQGSEMLIRRLGRDSGA